MPAPTKAKYPTGRVGQTCFTSGRALAPGDHYVGALVDVEGVYERRDFAPDIWEQSAQPKGLFAFWRGVVPDEAKKKHPVLAPDSARDLFEQLESAEDDRQRALRYILALWLVRKRLLVLGAHPDAAGALVVRWKGEPDDAGVIEVATPELSAGALADLSAQIGLLLGIDS